MRGTARSTFGALLVCAAFVNVGCAGDENGDASVGQDTATPAGAQDSAFAALQHRGEAAMGVNQYTSQHVFEDLPDGGRIELQRDTADAEDIATIRAHLKGIAEAFQNGDFRTPGMVHDMEVPGTTVMAERRALLAYSYHDLPRGGEVRITTQDSVALQAVRQFLAFQRMDHRTAH